MQVSITVSGIVVVAIIVKLLNWIKERNELPKDLVEVEDK